MKSWKNRPKEVSNLLNPAFCCTILTSSIAGYSKASSEGMPLPLIFMTLPVILHEPTRNSLPKNTRKSLATWIQDNATIRIPFYDRLMSLKPFTQEAMLFGLLHEWISLNEDNKLESLIKEREINTFLKKSEGDVKDCINRSKFLGRWFASAGSVQTVLALWGIRP